MTQTGSMKRALPFIAMVSMVLLAGCASSTTTTTPAAAPAKTAYTAPDNTFRISAEGTFETTNEDGYDTYTWEQDRKMTIVISESFTPEEVAEFTPQKIIDTTVGLITPNLKPESIVKTSTTFKGQPAVRVKGTMAQDGKDQYFDVLTFFINNHGYRVGMNSFDPISDAEGQAVFDSFTPLP